MRSSPQILYPFEKHINYINNKNKDDNITSESHKIEVFLTRYRTDGLNGVFAEEYLQVFIEA